MLASIYSPVADSKAVEVEDNGIAAVEAGVVVEVAELGNDVEVELVAADKVELLAAVEVLELELVLLPLVVEDR